MPFTAPATPLTAWEEVERLRRINAELLAALKRCRDRMASDDPHPTYGDLNEAQAAIRSATEGKE